MAAEFLSRQHEDRGAGERGDMQELPLGEALPNRMKA